MFCSLKKCGTNCILGEFNRTYLKLYISSACVSYIPFQVPLIFLKFALFFYRFCFIRYGGGPTLARRVISSGLSQTELAVEVYPLRLQLLLMPKNDQSAIRISKKVTPLSIFFSLLSPLL